MKAIETLLGIVDMKRADGLVLALGEVPALLTSGGRSPLTMPALSVEMMEHLLNEVFDPEQRKALRDTGSVDATYRSAAHGSYAIHAQASAEKTSLRLKRAARAVTPEVRPTAAAAQARSLAVPAATEVAEPTSAPVELVAAPLVERMEPAFGFGPFDAVLEEAIARRASDVIISAGRAPLMRVDGSLVECADAAPRPSATIETYVSSQLSPDRQRIFEATGSIDLAFSHPDSLGGRVRFRANAFRHDGGIGVALRPIVAEIPKLADIHLPPSLTQLVEPRTGLLLFTGPTGSGKSTTLAALLEHINRTRAAHIVTLEDPIEYVYRGRRSIIHQREVGQHVDGFASGLRAALRENPDVLLVGEMRDPETIRMTLTAAQTGHLVLSTIHSGSAVMALDRIIDGFPESEKAHVRQELAASLRHVVAQQLVPATAGGRLPVLEILTVNHAIASQIRDGRTHMVAMHLETGAEEGMVPMVRALANLVRAGRVTRSAALAASDHRETLEKLLDERAAGRTR